MDILKNLQGLYDQRVAELVKGDKSANELLLAIDAIRASRTEPGKISVAAQSPARVNPRIQHKMPVDDAVLQAIKSGVRSPIAMLKFLDDQLGVKTTISSIRTRLSRMKKVGRIAHDGRGWIMPSEVSEGLPLNGNDPPIGGSDAGEVSASPNLSQGST